MPVQPHRAPGGIAPADMQRGTRRRWMVICTLWLLNPRERPGTITKAGWASGLIWMGHCIYYQV